MRNLPKPGLWAIVIATAAAGRAAVGQAPAAENLERARLVVVVSIDQFPYEYIQRFWNDFSDKGIFRRLRQNGAEYANCRHRHAITVTAAGHSVMLTGAYPHLTGIVENEWYDRTTNRVVYGVGDPASPIVGAPTGEGEGISPKNLLAPTLGDEVKLATNSCGKVFGIAVKDRAAVLMTGHMADGAYWFDFRAGEWVTSRYYREDLPAYISEFNSSDFLPNLAGKTWELLYPAERYTDYYPDDSPFEGSGGIGRAFPHQLPEVDGKNRYRAVIAGTPFGNEMTLEIARRVIENEKLGSDEFPDVLCISLSPNDIVGHSFGPYSREVADITLRTDLMLGEFAAYVDSRMGTAPWLFVLCADHGVAPIPEHAAKLKLRSARQPLGKAADLGKLIEARLVTQLGSPADDKKYVQFVGEFEVFLQRDLPELAGDHYLTAQRAVRDFLLEQPSVAAAYTRETLLTGEFLTVAGAGGMGAATAGESLGLLPAFQRSFHPRRSGDVMFALEPDMIPSGGNHATHGSPWVYDSHVPLFIMGKGIRAGSYERPVSPAAIAPTLARLLRVQCPPACEVEPLYEVLSATGGQRGSN